MIPEEEIQRIKRYVKNIGWKFDRSGVLPHSKFYISNREYGVLCYEHNARAALYSPWAGDDRQLHSNPKLGAWANVTDLILEIEGDVNDGI